jgi:cardiolipin synthase
VLFVVMVVLILFPFMPEVWINGLTALCAILMTATLCLYIPVFRRM